MWENQKKEKERKGKRTLLLFDLVTHSLEPETIANAKSYTLEIYWIERGWLPI